MSLRWTGRRFAISQPTSAAQLRHAADGASRTCVRERRAVGVVLPNSRIFRSLLLLEVDFAGENHSKQLEIIFGRRIGVFMSSSLGISLLTEIRNDLERVTLIYKVRLLTKNEQVSVSMVQRIN